MSFFKIVNNRYMNTEYQKCFIACSQAFDDFKKQRNTLEKDMQNILFKFISSKKPKDIVNELASKDLKPLISQMFQLSFKHANDIDIVYKCVISKCDTEMKNTIYDLLCILENVIDILTSKECIVLYIVIINRILEHSNTIQNKLKSKKPTGKNPGNICITACKSTAKKYEIQLQNIFMKIISFMKPLQQLVSIKSTLPETVHEFASVMDTKKGQQEIMKVVVSILTKISEMFKQQDIQLDDIIDCFMEQCNKDAIMVMINIFIVISKYFQALNDPDTKKHIMKYQEIMKQKRMNIRQQLKK